MMTIILIIILATTMIFITRMMIKMIVKVVILVRMIAIDKVIMMKGGCSDHLLHPHDYFIL